MNNITKFIKNRNVFAKINLQLFYNIKNFSKFIVPLPQLGDSVSSGQIVSWEKKIGDNVKIDDILAIVSTDKVSIDICSPKNGILKEIYVQSGCDADVNKPICAIDENDSIDSINTINTNENEKIVKISFLYR